MHNKLILAFPLHDPQGKMSRLIKKNLQLLQKTFFGICIGVSPVTAKENSGFIDYLQSQGCFIVVSNDKANLGDRFRNILKVCSENFVNNDIYFGFIDRIIFALETKHKKTFITDITKKRNSDVLIFSRSKKAWATHPKNYMILENLATNAGAVFINTKFDWTWCGAVFSKKAIDKIVHYSSVGSFAIFAEWLLICIKNKLIIKQKKVDWLAWEDPFWFKQNKEKIYPELTQGNPKFRLNYIIDILNLFTTYFG